MSKRGFFFVFEGIDGCGKSTQARKLAVWLENRGYNVVLTEEPTNDFITGAFVKIALRSMYNLEPETYALLFAADRVEHARKVILPAMQSGKIVISDRYIFSSIVYQSEQGVEESFIEAVNKYGFVKPDAVFLIDVSPETAMERIKKRRAIDIVHIFERLEFMEKVRQRYLELAKKYPYFYIIDGERSIEDIHQDIVKIVERILGS